ncbi:heme exporter protein CcmB [Zavarzinia sp. CC-PAN008]|uniref:heme exporter protein CcmB n=1 Tax=Zavarzinia sp. CC-PAN008 TaxID=3243332 RepID=UPI003F742AF0
MNAWMNAFWVIVGRDVRLGLSPGGGAWVVLGFYLVATSLFPLGIGPDLPLLSRIGPGVLFVAALLATLLALERLFQTDLEDGSLDLLAVQPMPLVLVVGAKCLAHWLTTGVPLIVLSPVLGLILNLDGEVLARVLLAMAVGTPSLSLIGAVGAALTAGVRRGGVLLSLLVLPLYVPILIFGVGVVAGAPGALPLLGAILLGALPLAPLAAAAALRLAIAS